MIRIAGILCGSALAVALLLLVVGMPQLLPPETAVPAAAVTAEIAPQPSAEPIVEAVIDKSIEEVTEETAESVPEEQVVDEPEQAADTPEPLSDPPLMQQPDSQNWFAFWSPFRSELAANGFVSQLQRSTGMDYRVVKVKTGIYEVAFAYDNDADIETKLATITAATGLEMPGG